MPIGEITLDVGLDWSTAVSEFVGGLWFMRGLAANGDMTYNTTTQRFLALASPLASLGTSTAAGSTYRASKPHTIHTLAILFEASFPGGASATFQLNVDGTTQSGLSLSLVAGQQSAVVVGAVAIAQDAMVCLECTAAAGATPNILSMSIAYRHAPGANPDV